MRTARRKRPESADFTPVVSVKMKLVEILEARETPLSVSDVVEITGLSKSKVYQKIAEGELPAIRVDGSIKVDPNHLIAWLKQHQTGIASLVARSIGQKASRPTTTGSLEQAV